MQAGVYLKEKEKKNYLSAKVNRGCLQLPPQPALTHAKYTPLKAPLRLPPSSHAHTCT